MNKPSVDIDVYGRFVKVVDVGWTQDSGEINGPVYC